PSKKSSYATRTAQRRVRCNWRAHAQATSERVQSRSGPFSHQQRPQRISAQLSLLLRIDRTGSTTGTPTSVYARHAALQELRSDSALRRRGSVIHAVSCTKLALLCGLPEG